MITALIADDELLAREGISERLKPFKNIKIISESASGKDALNKIKELKPKLVFLDIQMPGLSGLEVLEHLSPNEMPYIIFVTAFDKYAVNAFEVNAVDYLLKPIDDSKFEASVNKVIDRIEKDNSHDMFIKLQNILQYKTQVKSDLIHGKIAVKSAKSTILLEIGDIFYIESCGDYLYIFTDSKKYLYNRTLSSVFELLEKPLFMQIHKSTIVNTSKIKEFYSISHGDYLLILENGAKIKLSRTFKTNFFNSLNIQI